MDDVYQRPRPFGAVLPHRLRTVDPVVEARVQVLDTHAGGSVIFHPKRQRFYNRVCVCRGGNYRRRWGPNKPHPLSPDVFES